MSPPRFLWHQIDVDHDKGRAECACGKWWTTTGAGMALLDTLAERHIEDEKAAVMRRRDQPGVPDDIEELRARILAAGEPVTDPLLRALRILPHVTAASAQWFPGWVEIHVELDEPDWDVRSDAIGLIDDFARRHVHQFSVEIQFHVPEFTRRQLTDDQAPT